jgi:methionyl aminopeptidase
MSIRSADDLVALRRVGAVVGQVLRRLEDHVRPGITTGDLDDACAAMLARAGARGAPKLAYGFPGTLCISVNDEAVHGVPGPRVIRAGDLVKLDLVAEMDGYFADAARTIVVPPAPAASRKLARSARRAFERALAVVQAGRRLAEIGAAVEAEVRRAGFRVIPALGGHGVGRAIHEEPSVPNVRDDRDPRRLTEGLVIAIEPIIAQSADRVFAAADGWTLRTADGSPAAHYEETVVVTRGRPLVLTAA